MVMVVPASRGVRTWSPSRSAKSMVAFSASSAVLAAWSAASPSAGSSAAGAWASSSDSSSKGLEAKVTSVVKVRSGFRARNRSSVMEKRAVTDSKVSPSWTV